MIIQKFGTGTHALVWLHGLNSTWDHEGIGRLCKNGFIDSHFTIFCPQNPDQKDWSHNELNTIKAYIIAQGPYTDYNIVGHSQGGIGCISAINFHQGFWKTAGISAGKTALKNYSELLFTKIKIWHHVSDPTVGTTVPKIFYPGMLAAGSDIEKLIYPGKSHLIEHTFDLNIANNYWEWVYRKLSLS